MAEFNPQSRKRMTTQNRQKSNAKKRVKLFVYIIRLHDSDEKANLKSHKLLYIIPFHIIIRGKKTITKITCNMLGKKALQTTFISDQTLPLTECIISL